jgi:hypothetical protein
VNVEVVEVTSVGLCGCGCGLHAPIAKTTDSRRGHIKGQPVRFIHNHQTRIRLRQDFAERFWKFVDRTSTPDGCWPWIGYRDKDGYGHIQRNGHAERAHRVALELAGWIIPCEWLQILHSCDNPACVRPDHLRIGTPHDDVADKVSKDRQARGERHGRAKLNPVKVQEILVLYQRGVRGRGCEALAQQFGVSPKTVWRILSGRSWRHVA